MQKISDVYNAINMLAPFALAEDWDNTGLLIGSGSDTVSISLVALDVTDAVIDEALVCKAGLIVTHHPVIMHPLNSIASNSIVHRLIRENIAVISAHTNLDIAQGGVNDAFAKRLGLTNLSGLEETSSATYYKIGVNIPVHDADRLYHAMAEAGAGALGDYSDCGFLFTGEGRFKPENGAHPHIGSEGVLEFVAEMRLEMLVAPNKLDAVLAAMKNTHPYEKIAYDLYHNYGCIEKHYLGRTGLLDTSMSPDAFAALVKDKLGIGGLKYVPGTEQVRKVAVCGGSGADLLHKAKALGCQALVTGESKHHLFLEASKIDITLIDAGHHATECVVLPELCAYLSERVPGINFSVAKSDGDNVRYI